MKLLTANKCTAVATSGTALSSDYAVANALTDQPGQPWIDQGGAVSTITLTCTLSANSDAFFLYNWLADTVEYSVNGGGAYTTLSSADENFVSDNLDSFLNSDILTKPNFTVVAMTSGNGLILRFQTTVDRKDSQFSGNAIANWDTDTGSTGHFEDSSNATINLNSHGRVLIGSHVDVGGVIHQVTKIIGDGTAAGAVTLSGSPIDGTVNSIKNPVKVGVVRVGTVETFNNASIGLQQVFTDYSIRRRTLNGAIIPTNRNTGRIFTGQFSSSVSEANSFTALSRAFRAKPVPVLVLNTMPSGDAEAFNYSSFVQFLEPPIQTFGGSQGNLRILNFRLKEIL